jgi:tRNA pseudouridine55 synthase
LVFGKTTPSIDLETEFDGEYPIDHISSDLITQMIEAKFLGEIKQLPPIYSAIKLDGQRLYKHARNGLKEDELNIKLREATIYQFQINTANFPEVDFEIQCSKGTYIRSIVRDIGQDLKSGAYLKKLVRTKIGDYSLESSQNLEHFNREQYEVLS